MQTKKMRAKRDAGYRRKLAQGLVPSRYDQHSRSFIAGAHKHWDGKTDYQIASLVASDRALLQQVRAAR